MKRSVFFTPAAQAEVIEAQDWYDGEAAGLGARFRGEVDFVVQRLGANPFQFPVVLADVRRAACEIAEVSLRPVLPGLGRSRLRDCLFPQPEGSPPVAGSHLIR